MLQKRVREREKVDEVGGEKSFSYSYLYRQFLMGLNVLSRPSCVILKELWEERTLLVAIIEILMD